MSKFPTEVTYSAMFWHSGGCLEHNEHIGRQWRRLDCGSGSESVCGCFDAFCLHENVTAGIHYNELNSNWPPLPFTVNEETTSSRLSRPRAVRDTQNFGLEFWMESDFNEPIWSCRGVVSVFAQMFCIVFSLEGLTSVLTCLKAVESAVIKVGENNS